MNSGALIAQARPAQEASPHINPMTAGVQAIQKAAGPLTDELMRKILVRWQAENMSGRTITLVVHKVAFTQLLDFKDRLMQFIRGVKSVTQRRYTDNTATLEVVFTGTGLDLATELARKDLGTIKMQVVNVLDGQVDVEVLKE